MVEVADQTGRPVELLTERNPPRLEVASAVSAVPPDPKSKEPSATEVSPVPPFPTVSAVPSVSEPAVSVPMLPLVEKRSVVDATVAKKFVVVAFVKSELPVRVVDAMIAERLLLS